MMRIRNIKWVFLILFFAFAINQTDAQMSYQLHKSRNESSWFGSASVGITSYIGDLARFNFDPIYKAQEESKFAMNFTAGKSFNHIYSAQAYYTIAGLKAYNNPQAIRYDAKLTSYGIQFLVNFNTLIGRMDYVPDIYIYGIIGAGMVQSKPVLYHISTDTININDAPIKEMNYTEKVSSTDLNFGLGLNYSALRNFDAYIEMNYHLLLSDEIDLVVLEKRDKYFHTQIGVRYRFAFAGNKGTSIFGRKRR